MDVKKRRKHYVGVCICCLLAVAACLGILKIHLEKHVVADDGRTRAIKAAKASYIKDMQTAIDWDCQAACQVDLTNIYGKNFLVPVYKSEEPLKLDDLEKLVRIEEEILGDEPIWITDYYLLASSGECLKVNGESVLLPKMRREDGELLFPKKEQEETAPSSEEKTDTEEENESSENGSSTHKTQKSQAPPKKSFYHADPKDTNSEPEDALHVEDYWSVEDFYEDNVDTFDGLDDAEDYYDEHGGF